MAPTRKSAKRTAGKKRTASKRSPAKKRAAGKAASKRRSRATRAKATVKKTARKALRTVRGPLNTVLGAGEKTWETLKSTTAQVVEGVKGTLGVDESPNSR